MTWRRQPAAVHAGAALGAVAVVTLVLGRWLQVSNAAVVSTTYLLIVLLVAATSRLWVAVATSVVAMLCFNFFFLPPVGAFAIADPQNWVALFAFLAVSLVASNLSAVARARTQEAVGRRDELARLFDLSRDVLVITDSREAIVDAGASRSPAASTWSSSPSPCRASDDWDVFEAGARDDRDGHGGSCPRRLPPRRRSLEFDAYARTYAGHRTMEVDGRDDSAGAAAGRHQADRPAGRRGPADRGRHARHARRRGGDRDRARAVSRRAQGGRADPAERGS